MLLKVSSSSSVSNQKQLILTFQQIHPRRLTYDPSKDIFLVEPVIHRKYLVRFI